MHTQILRDDDRCYAPLHDSSPPGVAREDAAHSRILLLSARSSQSHGAHVICCLLLLESSAPQLRMSVGSGVVDLPSYLYSPRVSPIQISTVPFRVNAVKFAPSSASSALASSSHRLIALGSHQSSSSNRVSLHQLDTDVDVLSGDEDDADIGKEKLSDTLAAVSLQGDVNDIAWLRSRLLAAASSTGCIHLLSHAPKQPQPPPSPSRRPSARLPGCPSTRWTCSPPPPLRCSPQQATAPLCTCSTYPLPSPR